MSITILLFGLISFSYGYLEGNLDAYVEMAEISKQLLDDIEDSESEDKE